VLEGIFSQLGGIVISFALFVDLYRPKYGVLENMETIVQARHNRTNNLLPQLFCVVVGMGYQTQLILGDSWSHGAPQTRKRVFLYLAAPGLRLPETPLASHSHSPMIRARDLGAICNGEPFVRRLFGPVAFKYVSAGEATADLPPRLFGPVAFKYVSAREATADLPPRLFGPAAFKYVSAREATADLPPIQDAKPDCCIAFPDHRVVGGMTARLRVQFAAILIHPYGMNFAKAWREGKGVMSVSDRPYGDGERANQMEDAMMQLTPFNSLATYSDK
jgi:DNA (cytosine-5)-methyltransferase 1